MTLAGPAPAEEEPFRPAPMRPSRALAVSATLALVLAVGGCASAPPPAPAAPAPETVRLADALVALGAAPLPAGLAEGTEA